MAQTIARAQDSAFDPRRVALMVVGEEVPHVHLHVVPFFNLGSVDFANAAAEPDPEAMDEAAARLRQALVDAGHDEAAAD